MKLNIPELDSLNKKDAQLANVKPVETKADEPIPLKESVQTPVKDDVKTETVQKTFQVPSMSNIAGIKRGRSEILNEAKNVTDEKLKVVEDKIVETEHSEIYVELDKRDEAQISGEIVGNYVRGFVYEYCPTHRWPGGVRPQECKCANIIRDLSWLGIQEASRSMSLTVKEGTTWVIFDDKNIASFQDICKLEDPGIIIHDFPNKIRVAARVYDPRKKISRMGVAEQLKIQYTKKGPIDDVHCQQKAMSKAQRNALRQLLPQTDMRMWIDKFLLDKNGHTGVEPTVSDVILDEIFKIIEDEKIGVTKEYVRKLIQDDRRGQYILGQLKANGIDGLAEWVRPQLA